VLRQRSKKGEESKLTRCFILYALNRYFYENQIRQVEVDETYSTYGREETIRTYRVLVRKLKGRNNLEKHGADGT
jgi:hypothetical protein